MLLDLDALVERVRGISFQNGDRRLGDDGAGIYTGIHIVNGHAGHLHPVVQSLFPGMKPLERRQKGRMDIDNAVGESFQEIRFDNPHEPGQGDPFRSSFPKCLDLSLFGITVQTGPGIARGDIPGGDPVKFGTAENAGIG